MKDIIQEIREANIRDAETWIKEAEFGLGELGKYIHALDQSSSILEIGCGSGILLGLIAQKYPSHILTGIEPFQGGFEYLKEISNHLKDVAQIHEVGYQEFTPSQQYDLIYLVNVFEYLPDYQNFITLVSSWLTPSGKIIIMGSNFAFPFEFHFRVPIIFNKECTYLIFKNLIKKREDEYGTRWDDLNFIPKTDLTIFLKKNSLISFIDDIDINFRLIDRLSEDPQFAERQKFIGYLARSVVFLRLRDLARLFKARLPYMKIIISSPKR